MQAEVGQLSGCHVIAELAGLSTLGDQMLEECGQVLLRVGDVLAAVQQSSELGSVSLVGDLRELLQHCFGLFGSVVGVALLSTKPDQALLSVLVALILLAHITFQLTRRFATTPRAATRPC
ncbi:hypothetical protein KBO27_32360 [Saccharopolyspora endophytica]|uniref:Uncharacterized protein n=1 Tax=Saccharopolyspora endophytica TaxID=543886 RepID=A0ABS5DQV9_9PSEU|nr:hypothetical protein [Saccharopolyspora endophytica]MBQ0928663.1 hypothetical protein [Saccharopolyspora endophytica]